MPPLLAVLIAVFVAELGDKTQLATFLFAADGRNSPGMVFVAAASALCLSTALAVFVGGLAGHFLDLFPLKLIAGIGFITIGVWTVSDHFQGGA
jgi:putative Ca2+/H+ antiporter (TMEM165/GDT1 family)